MSPKADKPQASLQFGSQKPLYAIAFSLVLFFTLQAFLRLRTTIILGADEGFELAKATLCLHGYHLYTDIWNDQPPLLTFLVTGILKYVSLSPAGPRLLTGLFSAILLSSIFFVALRASGLSVAWLAIVLLIASPGFLILGSTCMLEVPALATAVAALAVLQSRFGSPWKELLAGVIFGVSLEIKLINFILLPIAVILYWQKAKPSLTSVTKSLLFLFVGLVASTILTDQVASGGSYLAHFGTTLTSHFGAIKSTEHGSPADHPFDWLALVKSWDLTLPAIIGAVICVRRRRDDSLSLLPVAWFVLEFLVFGIHRPWWHYYTIHTSAPMCWCAAIAWVALFRLAIARRHRLGLAVLILASFFAAVWMGARLYVQIVETRNSPQTYTSLFLQEIRSRKPNTKWFYCEEPIYSFHAQIPMPPDLAVVMLKRFWSGEISDEQVAADLWNYKPGLILLRNNSLQRPFSVLLDSKYQVIYMDNDHLLYEWRDIGKSAHKKGPAMQSSVHQ